MRVTTVSYKKIFPIQQFVNETIGVEMQVDEGENEDLVFAFAKTLVEEWHRKTKDKVLATEPFEGVSDQVQQTPITPIPLKWHELPVIDRQYDKIEIAIDNAQTIAELNALSKDGLPLSLITMLNQKVKELQKK